jgi:hypothetical protein
MCRRGRRGNSSGSTFTLLVVFSLLILGETVATGTDAGRASALDETLAAVRDCMDRCRPPWPEAWQGEYLDTIRQAASRDPNVPQYARRLEILREGFALYWPDMKNTQERTQFEVRRAQTRWYIENLMTSELPGEEETALLRHQYEDLANHAAQGLITQFSFLDPNKVQDAKADYLADCYRKIDATLLPIFLTPFSQGQIEQIKERWHDLRYARVDLWRQLGGGSTPAPANRTPPSGEQHLDCLLMQRSLDQLCGQLWTLIPGPPDYYRDAVSQEIDARKRWLQARADAKSQEDRLGMPVLQTEYLSFLLTALLETAECIQEEGQ